MVDQGKAIKHVKHVMTCHFFMTAGPASAHPFGTNQNCLERRFGVPRLRKVEAWQINLGTLSQTSDHEFWVDEQCGTSNRSSHPATQHHPLHPPHNPPQPLSHLVTLPLPERLLSHSATLAEWPAIQPLSHSVTLLLREWLSGWSSHSTRVAEWRRWKFPPTGSQSNEYEFWGAHHCASYCYYIYIHIRVITIFIQYL